MSIQSLKSLSEQAVNLASDLGASGCDIIAAKGSSFSLSAQQEKIDKFKVSSSNVMGIRIIKDNRIGLSYTEAVDDEAISKMVHKAVEVSQYSGEDEYQNIEVEKGEFVENNPDLYQSDDTETDSKLDLALALESEIKKGGPKVKNAPYNGYADGESEVLYLNHLGRSCYHKERSFSCYTTALTEHDGRQAMYGYSMMSRQFKDLKPGLCAEEALRFALPLLEGRSVPTGKYDLIFAPDELNQLFGCFLSVFSAKSAMEGKNKFRDQLGKSVADSRITIFDRPKYDGGFYYSSFDDEGVPRQDLCLVQGGELKSFYHNTATANYFDTKTTAHGARSPKGPLGVSGTHLVFDTGHDSNEQVQSGRYIKVIGLKGLHSGTNAISGQFSLAIDGILMNGNEVEQYVRDVTISGNFFSLLNQVESIGNTLEENTGKSFFAPLIKFGGISVAGA